MSLFTRELWLGTPKFDRDGQLWYTNLHRAMVPRFGPKPERLLVEPLEVATLTSGNQYAVEHCGGDPRHTARLDVIA